jgi:hypothetical protein
MAANCLYVVKEIWQVAAQHFSFQCYQHYVQARITLRTWWRLMVQQGAAAGVARIQRWGVLVITIIYGICIQENLNQLTTPTVSNCQ